MKTLRILPHSRDEWIALPLFPFKAWVLIAFPLYVCFSSCAAAQHVRHSTGTLGEVMIGGYMLSAAALLFGALIQSIVGKRGAAIQTAIYALAGIILVFSIYRF